MPSPLGHALAGVAAGWIVAPPAGGSSTVRTAATVAAYAAVGMLPDVDLAFGSHSGPTHGIGAAVIAGAVTMLVLRRSRGATSRWLAVGLAVSAAYGTHILLDWLGTDTSAPIGIMALWPFSRDYYESSLHVFMAISRRYWLPGFWSHNLAALAREIAILVPVVAAIMLGRRRARTPAGPYPSSGA